MGSYTSSVKLKPSSSMSQTMLKMVPVTWSAGNMMRRTSRGSNMEGVMDKVGILGGLGGAAYVVSPIRNWQSNKSIMQTDRRQGQGQCHHLMREMVETAVI